MTQFRNIEAQPQEFYLDLQTLATVEMAFLKTHYTDSLKNCKRPPNTNNQ